MKVEYYKVFSDCLQRDMEFKVYGHGGRPVLYIPCQDGKFVDFENFKMTDYWGPYIENGDFMVFSIDTMDAETWSDKWGNADWRSWRHECWMQFIRQEMVPFIREVVAEANQCDDTPGIISFGCSLGATHAANLFFRWPDVFTGCLALSGLYNSSYGFGTFMNEYVYNAAPLNYLPNMPEDHPYIDLYNQGQCIICCGQGAWEEPDDTRQLDWILKSKGINVWVDFWGHDVNHDWPWWYKQVEYFLPHFL